MTLAKAKRSETTPGVNEWIATFPEAASQSYTAADFVYLASGKVTVCAAGGADVASGVPILGRTLQAASGTTDTDAQVLVAQAGQMYELPCVNDDAAATTAAAQIGTAYELRRVATSLIWGYNTGGTTDTKVVPVKFLNNVAASTVLYPATGAGESAGTAMCEVLAAQRQLQV